MFISKWLASGLMSFLVALSLALPADAGAARPAAVKKKSEAKPKAAKPAKATSKVAAKRALSKRAAAPVRYERRVVIRGGKRVVVRQRVTAARAAPARLSMGQLKGLHKVPDALDLKSSVAFVLDQETDEVLFSKNSRAVLPIASLTKLMTALVVAEAGLPMQEILSVSQADVDTERGSRSRLQVGTTLTRVEMLHLALMSSENRAAHALGRNYPGGVKAFVGAMNRKAVQLGMKSTRFSEPTGLSSNNRSSARDLATLVKAAHDHRVIREMSTSPSYEIDVGSRHLQFVSTNRLVNNPEWEIGLQKTGYISEAGRCLVMQTRLAGRDLIMVFLDSAGRYSRLGDAERVRRWIEENFSESASDVAPVIPKITS